MSDILLANILHATQLRLWQAAGDNTKAPPKYIGPTFEPEADPENGDQDTTPPSVDEDGTYHGEMHPSDEIAQWLGWS